MNEQEWQIERLRAALMLAESHISWLWDIVETNTRLRRAGSADILSRIRDAVEEESK